MSVTESSVPNKSKEQTLVDLCFQFALLSAEHMQGKTREEIAEWVRGQLREMGFPTTPIGMSWGVLDSSSIGRSDPV